MVERFDYEEMLAVANELIDEFGQDGTLSVPGTKTGDAWNPTIGAPSSVPCVCVEIDFNRNEIDGKQVLATDKRVFVKAGGLSADIVPGATQITYNGKVHQIVGPVKQINPAGLNLAWEMQVRI